MQCDFFMLSPDQVVDNMGPGSGPPTVAEPFFANITQNDASWVVDTAVFASIFRQFLNAAANGGGSVLLFFFILELEVIVRFGLFAIRRRKIARVLIHDCKTVNLF